jgi:hypothetical protein
MVTDEAAGTVPPSAATRRSASAGKYLPIGSSSNKRPCSTSIMTPTETSGLVME